MVDKILRVSKPFRLGFCACGCGAEIGLRRNDGYLRRFVNKHNARGKNNVNYGDGTRMSKGYREIWMPTHPHATKNGYVREHRLIMEKYLGRYLDPKESVHHINEDKLDNRIENLQLFETEAKHQELHSKQYYENVMNKRKCIVCGCGTTGAWFRNPLNKSEWMCRIHYRHKMKELTGKYQ